MKLYVIGNGFDLAHKLPTSYRDYYEFVKKHANKENGWGIILDYYPDSHVFWSDVETNICKIDKGVFLQTKNIFGVSILDALLVKIKESFEKFILDAEKKIACLESLFSFDENSVFISFNYTTVLEEIYNIPSNKVMHLHNTSGDIVLKHTFSLDAEEIVLGHGPDPQYFFFWKDPIVGNDKDYISFRNKTQKNTKEIMEKNNLMLKLISIQNTVEEVVFYGFSFSPNDKDYLQMISMCIQSYRTKFKAYYYVPDDKIENGVIEKLQSNIISCALDLNQIELINSKGVYKI